MLTFWPRHKQHILNGDIFGCQHCISIGYEQMCEVNISMQFASVGILCNLLLSVIDIWHVGGMYILRWCLYVMGMIVLTYIIDIHCALNVYSICVGGIGY